MLNEAFCSTCMRTVYRGAADDLICPVCSSPLAVTGGTAELDRKPRSADPLIPEDEDVRMAAVGRYDILDTPPDGAFDRITALAATTLAAPISTITIVDRDRIWFKSKYGVDVDETGRDPGLCASAVLSYEPLVVTDALDDPRTLDNPLVRGELGLRFYAGVPLTTADGHNLGTLNVIDTEPRELGNDQLKILEELAAIVVDELELRLAALRLYRKAAEQGLDLTTDASR